MPSVDVVARLQLRAEQFSSETGRAFAEMKTRAASAASEIRGSFTSSFAEVQKLAAQALTVPRTAGGSLDLSGEIASLRQSASAADQAAQAQRELSIAFTAASAAGRGDAEALKLEADAAAVASLASERDAAAIRDRIMALESVQGELSKVTSATDRHAAGLAKAGVSAGQQRLGLQQLGFQLNDISSGFSSGIPPMQIFAQQGSQVVQSLQLMTNKTTGFLGFLAGSWGAILTAATVVMVPLVAKMFEQADAAKEAELATSGLSDAESTLAAAIGNTTSKIAAENSLLLINARLKAANLKISAINDDNDARKAFAAIPAGQDARAALGAGFGFDPGGNPAVADLARRAELARRLPDGAGRTKAFDQIIKDAEATSFKDSGTDFTKFGEAISKAAAARANIAIADLIDKSLNDNKIAPELARATRDKRGGGSRTSTAPSDTTTPRELEQITRINEQWNETPKLVDKAADANRELDKILADITKRKPPGFEAMIEQIGQVRETIAKGLTRPFDDYVKAQEQSLAVGKMVLAGRDAEANAVQDVLRLEQQEGPLTSAQIARVTALAQQQERIRDLIEDQQRIVNISVGSARALQQTFDQFLGDLESRPTKALGGLIDGAVNSFKQLQRDLWSNAIFGGIDRDIAKYVREITGQQTPKDIIDEQAKGAGTALKDFADTVESITFRLGGGLSALDLGAKGGFGSAPSAIQALLNGNAANDNGNDGQDIVVRAVRDQSTSTIKLVDGIDIYRRVTKDLVANLDKLGITIPKAIADALPGAIQGASIFSSIGSQFGAGGSKIGGGLGAALGAILGPNSTFMKSLGPIAAAYQLGQSIQQPIAKSLHLSSGLTSIGGIPLAALGSLFGIGPKIDYSGAGLSVGANGVLSGTAGFGRGKSAISGAADSAGGVAGQLNAILDQLGATVSSLAPITVGMWNGNYRVARANTTEALNGNSSVAKAGLVENFGTDQAAAIAYAVQYELSHAIISGISAASQRLLAGGDAQAQLAKVMLVEAIPKDLKSMLDPVGAAIDDLNRGWTRTVAALDEGGASAEQYAQAQQLYKLQLDQVKASTASASATLKDFRDSLNFGSASPYSFRDQEASARAALQPYLDTINGGGNVDQGKYQDAAKAFLDIERQLYGSTQAYFDALDSIQAATNKAISTIDNAVPITPGVPDPFTRLTADAAAKTAQGVQTGNEMAEDTNSLLAQIAALMAQVAANTGGSNDNSFIGDPRLFTKTG